MTAGTYSRPVVLRPIAGSTARPAVALTFTVRPPPDTRATAGMVLINPTFLTPPNYAVQSQPPKLCWTVSAAAGPAPLTYRVMVVGPQAADSGWISTSCWSAPALPAGQYAWKVFIRDGQGYMTRPNQRPWVFRLR